MENERPLTSSPGALDPNQLHRIESIHRGFLYQHLYAVASLLAAKELGCAEIRVETDEDVELRYPDLHLYVQVKTRSEALRKTDVSTTLKRFESIRATYAAGERAGNFALCVLSNAAPTRGLLELLASNPDVKLVWPAGCFPSDGEVDQLIPPAFLGVTEALGWCAEKAKALPFASLPPETLVWKLAAIVQCASAGEPPYSSHQFSAAELPGLFEQVVLQLHEFPEVPDPYRPQEDEPAVESDERVRLLVGLSGSGKTSWAAQQAMHFDGMIGYYDAGGTPDGNLATALTRELAARWGAASQEALATVLFPGATGLESLRALDVFLEANGLRGLVVVDNAHTVGSTQVREVIEACRSMAFLLLAQPGDGSAELEARLAVQAIGLNGWSLETIAAEFSSQGCSITPEVSSRIRQMTGGLPLYVRSAADLTKRHYQGDTGAFCRAWEKGEHIATTAQEAILSRSFRDLDQTSRDYLAVLSLSTVPLEREEILHLGGSTLSITGAQAANRLRTFQERGMVRLLTDGRILMHDAFRPLSASAREELGRKFVERCARQLSSILSESIKRRPDAPRSLLLVRLLPLAGDVRSVVSFASDEFFYEYGLAQEFESLLYQVAMDEAQSADDRFWALDAVAFFALNHGEEDAAERFVSMMEEVIAHASDPVVGIRQVLIKKLLIAGRRRQPDRAKDFLNQLQDACAGDESVIRIGKYNYALALYSSGLYEQAEREVFGLVIEYYDFLGLDWHDVFAKSIPEIAERLGDKVKDQDTLKHLADSLDLYASSRNGRGLPSGLARLVATKFYAMAYAVSSFIRVGQDAVDELLDIVHDPWEAKKFLETNVIPAMAEFNLLGYLVPVRSQHAVLLAYCGEFEQARTEMAELRAFARALPESAGLELENQQHLIDSIERGEVRLPPPRPAIAAQPVRKVGRNEPCPCGSGVKYKRCHGRR